MDGSSLVPFKAALVTALQARSGLSGVPVTQEPIINAEDLQSTTGAYEVIALGDATWARYNVAHTGVAVEIDEEYTLDVVIQVLKKGATADTQAAADARASQLLAEVIGTLCADPSVGIATTSNIVPFWALPTGNAHKVGWLGKGDQHGSVFLLQVTAEARLKLI